MTSYVLGVKSILPSPLARVTCLCSNQTSGRRPHLFVLPLALGPWVSHTNIPSPIQIPAQATWLLGILPQTFLGPVPASVSRAPTCSLPSKDSAGLSVPILVRTLGFPRAEAFYSRSLEQYSPLGWAGSSQQPKPLWANVSQKEGRVDWKSHDWAWRGLMGWQAQNIQPLWAEETLSRAGWSQAGLDSATISGLWALVDSLGNIPGPPWWRGSCLHLSKCRPIRTWWTVLPLTWG